MNHKEKHVAIEGAQKMLDDAMSNLKSTSTNRENRADNFVVQTVQIVKSADDIYNNNASVMKSASDAILGLSQGEIKKKTTADFLAAAKNIMAALDVVKQVHPFLGVAILTFQGVVKLELTRRENDHRVWSVLSKASDMMSIFLQLKDVEDPSITGFHGEKIEGRLQGVLEHIKEDMLNCGCAIDKYWKSKFITKFFRSENWAIQFTGICQSFSERKDDLQLALTIRTSSRVDIAMDKLEQLIHMQSERELRFEKEVKLRGGRDKCLESPDLMVKLMEASEQRDGRPQNRPPIEVASKDSNMSASSTTSANEQNMLDVSLLLHELHVDLPTLLQENRASFMLAYAKQTSTIQDSISSSEARIIRTINANNIFRQIKDPHLQYIWKQMKWRTSVKTQYFIAELYDYYMNRFSRLQRDTLLAQETPGASSVVVPGRHQDYISDFDSEEEDHNLPEIDPADEWCLKYLTVFYVPSLSEGFDGDADSLVSIREVNAFTSTIPPNWSLPQALAYWAAGWRVDSQHYHVHIEQIMESMNQAQVNALPENRKCIAEYLNSNAIRVKQLVRSLADLDSEDSDSDLMQLASWRRQAQELELRDKLEQVKYEIDSTDSIKLFGSGRIENFVLPLLYLVIRRHLQIMKLASTVILVDKELQFATQSIQNIMRGIDLRVKQLTVTFHQQGSDPKVRFAWYAHGLYKIWYSPDLNPDDSEYWASNDFPCDDTQLEINNSALKFGPFSLEKANEQLEKPIQLVGSNSGHEPEGPKEEYIRLWCLNKLHSDRWSSRYDDIPQYILPEQKKRFKILSKQLPSEDIKCWSSLAELHLRKRVTGCYCDACHSHIIDVRHHCMECEGDDYDLCIECEFLSVSKHKHRSNHKSTHNMLTFLSYRPHVLRNQARMMANIVLDSLPPPEGSLSDTESDGSETDTDESETDTDGTEPDMDEPAMDTDGQTVDTDDSPKDTDEETVDTDESTKDTDGPANDTGTGTVTNEVIYTCAECRKQPTSMYYVCIDCILDSENLTALCCDCAFLNAFSAVKEHDQKHNLLKIKYNVQDEGGISDDSKSTDEATLSALSLRVDNLAAMVESRFAELDRRLGELMEKGLVHK